MGTRQLELLCLPLVVDALLTSYGCSCVSAVSWQHTVLIKSLGAARLQREIVSCFDSRAAQTLLNQVMLVKSIALAAFFLFQNARIVAIVLVIVLDDDAGSLEHVPRVINAPSQVRFLSTSTLGWRLIFNRITASRSSHTALLLFGAGGQITFIAPARVIVFKEIALAAKTIAELRRTNCVLEAHIDHDGCNLRV